MKTEIKAAISDTKERIQDYVKSIKAIAEGIPVYPNHLIAEHTLHSRSKMLLEGAIELERLSAKLESLRELELQIKFSQALKDANS